MSELNPCPFCGGKARKYVLNSGEMTIACANWYENGGNCRVDSSTAYYKRIETCIKHWNTRPIEQALTAELARTKEMLARLWFEYQKQTGFSSFYPNGMKGYEMGEEINKMKEK